MKRIVFLVALLALPALAADGLFITVGGIDGVAADGHKIEGQFGVIYTSPDGEAWTQAFKGGPIKDGFNHANNNLLRCLTYGNGKLVATGNAKCAVVSEDGGKTWKMVETPSGSFSVAFGNGLFVAPNASHFMTSTDGVTWEHFKQPGDFKVWGKDGAGHVRKIVYGNGVFVCVGEQRWGVTDGKTWLKHKLVPEDKRVRQNLILFGNGVFLWLRDKREASRSKDCKTWEPLTIDGVEGAIGNNGLFDGKHFWISPAKWNDKQKMVYKSADGVSWEALEANATPTLRAGGNGILLGNHGWSKSFALSKDGGKTWKQIKADVPSRQVYFFDGKAVRGPSGG